MFIFEREVISGNFSILFNQNTNNIYCFHSFSQTLKHLNQEDCRLHNFISQRDIKLIS